MEKMTLPPLPGNRLTVSGLRLHAKIGNCRRFLLIYEYFVNIYGYVVSNDRKIIGAAKRIYKTLRIFV